MAIFIPRVKPEDFNNSYGEKMVYEALRSLSDQYTVFYSFSWVGINEHRTIGEADFVILHPDKGVLVIEVKSGEIEYKDREWLQTNTRTRVTKRIDPLGQARKSQFELMDRLEKSDCRFKRPMMCYCAWFPSVEIPADMTLPAEAAREIVLDKKSLDNPEKALDACFSYWETKFRIVKLTDHQFQMVVNALCPHFHVVPSLKTQIQEKESTYILLTNQQAALLDFLEEQRTAVIHGLAGTGKTVLAIEKAKRLASQNQSVLFLCFNSFLRDMLKENNAIPGVTFHNVHSLAYEILGDYEIPLDKVIPVFEEYINGAFNDDTWNYSDIIVDEGQDLDDLLLNKLYQLANKKHGCFYVFYDRNQYVMKKHLPEWIENSECRLVLHKNCRNTAEVFKTSCSIMGLEKVTYNDVHGDIPAVKFYQTTSELETIVDDFIKQVCAEGLNPEDIVILTAKTTESSWLSVDKEYGGKKISLSKEPGKVLFTTIRKFKGLEAEAILIVDTALSSLSSADSRRLLYVGSSRAKNLLNIAMLDDIEREEMGDLLKSIAPDRHVPKNKKGLKRLLNITIQ